jgi:hypothetical protein
MKIQKIELIDNGQNGMIVSGVRTELKEEGTVFIDFNDTHKVPVPVGLRSLIQATKRFMAISLNVGIEAHVNEAFDKQTEKKKDSTKVSLINFLDSLTITKISKKDDIFYIAGKICNTDNMTIGLCSPKIFPTTEYNFYSELCEEFDFICIEVKHYVESKKVVAEAKQYLLELFPTDTDQQANVVGMSEHEAELAMIKKLEEKGHFVMSPEYVSETPPDVPKEEVPSSTDDSEF